MKTSSSHTGDTVIASVDASSANPGDIRQRRSEQDPPLRVGVLLANRAQPVWVERSLRLVATSPFARIELIATTSTSASTLSPSRPGLIHRLLAADRRLFRRQPDATVLVDALADEALSSIPYVAADEDRANIRSAIRAADLDILLCPGTVSLGRDLASEVRQGIWYFPELEDAINTGLPIGFDSTVHNTGNVTTSLREIPVDGSAERIVYASTSAANAYSPHYTERRVLWKMATFPARALERRWRHDPTTEHVTPEPPATRGSAPLIPGPFDTLIIAARFASRLAGFTIRALTSRSEWALAARNDTGLTEAMLKRKNPPGTYRPIPNPPGAFWADPFPIVDGEQRWLFVEEFPYNAPRAHIAVMEILPDGKLGPSTVVLSRPWHFSYPFVFRDGDTWYMIPETIEHHAIDLYRSTRFPFEWIHERTLFDTIDAVDTTVVEIEGWWWLFTTIAPYGGSENDDLHIFRARSPKGPWVPLPGNPQVSDIRRGRCAGRIFELDGDWYRPAQDCTGRYGAAMSINRITHLAEDGYAEECVARIDPTWDNDLLGTHTFNHIPGFTVIDGDRWRSRWRGKRAGRART